MITAHSKKWSEDLNAEFLYVNALNGESLFSSNPQWREIVFVFTENSQWRESHDFLMR